MSPLLTDSEFRDLVSGRRRGLRAALWRGALRALELPYSLAIAWRNRLYDRRKSPVHRVAVPVISVGNITVGGTGKTPTVEWLARWFRDRGVRVTLVSRGYRPAVGPRNDEALELEQRLPEVPHLQNSDRVAAALTAIEQFESQLILLDDAFQHRRIHRDLDIVLIDALEPFGYGHLLPRGLLREPVASLARANVIGLSRSDLATPEERARIRETIRQVAPRAVCVDIAHRPKALLAWPQDFEPTDTLLGKPIAAFCGIGNPEGFRRTLAQCNLPVVAFRAFADHHPYCREDIASLASWARKAQASAVLCTHKDLVKIRLKELGNCSLRAILVGIEVLTGLDELESCLWQLVADEHLRTESRP